MKSNREELEMKRFILIVLLAAIIIVLTGCSEESTYERHESQSIQKIESQEIVVE